MSGILLPDHPEYQRLLALARPGTADERDAWRAVKRHYAEQHKRVQYGVESFEDFVKRNRPRYWPVPPHLKPLYSLIERSRHEQVRAMISFGPRHGKTETLMLALAWRTLVDPACQQIYATYGSDLSEPMGMGVRALALQNGVPIGRAIQSETVKGSSGKVLDWRTRQGGGLKSTSVGGGITGRPVHGLCVLDDIIKGYEAAMSLTERERVWNWLITDVLSRLEAGASVILCGTRFHEDDPAGRIQNGGSTWIKGLGEEWEVLNIPAVHDGNWNPIDERLYPEQAKPCWAGIDARHPNDEAAAMAWYAIKRAAGEHRWWSLYQGVPRTTSQRIYQIDPPTFALPRSVQLQRAAMIGKRAMLMLDPAAKKTTKSDHNALGSLVMDGFGDRVVEVTDELGRKHDIINPNPSVMQVFRMWKERCAVPDAVAKAKAWQKLYNLLVGVESDGTSANLPDWIKLTEPTMRIVPVHTHGKDKFTRSIPSGKAWNDNRIQVPAWVDENGNIVDVGWEGTDVEDFLRVMKAFTGHDDPEDDMADVIAHGWNRLYKPFQGLPSYVRAPAY